jgi:hypothetical protein
MVAGCRGWNGRGEVEGEDKGWGVLSLTGVKIEK